jgi:hypothetical protein
MATSYYDAINISLSVNPRLYMRARTLKLLPFSDSKCFLYNLKFSRPLSVTKANRCAPTPTLIVKRQKLSERIT